jgi:hypothetical protein
MTTASGKGFWVTCEGGCGKRTGSGWRVKGVTPDMHICAGCAKASKVMRECLFPDTDTVQERMALTSTAQVAKVQQGSHKALFTEGGHVKGGTPEAVTKAVQAKLPKAAPKVAKAPKVKAPKVAKVAAKVARKRPTAKTA